ncbi:hypothetical protein BU24DRAFT_426143 [Aaosphaeria arxii CBS 175.79]|uniref:Uncharacterized protein n=1 Tax=Aaosphaeria arxii CBS 175.79 TaxID=1450172 RepID=A0A6A5XHJ7_9PLEO|nr:uncharacterized protein BU24DRAFT_426143 [Aaosphaeria arxii CBS 175.79]KAF2012281.1 hypothetical protein BU24DRAFT_426143 [Aaosphaeria arxii CBS 175.79]
MLAGPPRLLSLVSVALLFGLAWWYLNLVQNPPTATAGSGVSNNGAGLNLDTSPAPAGGGATKPGTGTGKAKPLPIGRPYQGDPLDFGIAIRFTEPVAKPPGSTYSHIMVVPKTMKEDITWMDREIPDTPKIVYEVDNPDAENKVPQNKGREAMVYLTYIIDHYDKLPDTVLFMHAHRFAWHNNILQGQDSVRMIKSLNHERIARLGYMNVRCHHEPGCPDWIHMDRPGGDFDFFKKPEEIHWRRHIWEELHPGAPIPPSLSGVCCAQFAVTGDRIRQIPLERFIHYRKWLLTTTMDDQFSGRIFEYIWHYIFTGHEVYCPAQNTCYCDGYGICFGGRQNYTDYNDKQDERNKLFEELDVYQKKEAEAEKEGRKVEWDDRQKKRIEELRGLVHKMDPELERLRNEALERGKDAKARQEETENWSSEKIWEYMPKNG